MPESTISQGWDEEQGTLPLPSPKVVPLGRDERLSGPEQAELLRRCPRWARDTLRLMLTLTAGRRRLFASRTALEVATGLEWRTLKRHRAALVDAGILEPRGGGHRGRTAAYWIRTAREADDWLLEQAARRAAEGGCPICHEHPATHTPRRCPDFGRPVQESLEVE